MKIGYSRATEVLGSGWPKFWMEDEVKEGETPEQAMERVFNMVEGSHKKFFPPSPVVKKPLLGNKVTDAENERQYKEIMGKIIAAKTREEAQKILSGSIWKKLPELKQLVLTKPAKGSKKKNIVLP